MSKLLCAVVALSFVFCGMGCRSVSKKTPAPCDCSLKEPFPPPVAVKVTPEPMLGVPR